MSTVDLWRGNFGNEYHQRNRVEWKGRLPFWESALSYTTPSSVFELGCGPGWNLQAIGAIAPATDCHGADVNQDACNEARSRGFDVIFTGHREGEFAGIWPDGCMDLVFTAGCLIHIPSHTLKHTMEGLVDLSARYILAIEYHADTDTEEPVEYRGQSDALWKRNYGQLYQELGLTLLSQGPAEGFDDCTYYLLEKAT
jgi:trans-aconitate methyltransferase